MKDLSLSFCQDQDYNLSSISNSFAKIKLTESNNDNYISPEKNKINFDKKDNKNTDSNKNFRDGLEDKSTREKDLYNNSNKSQNSKKSYEINNLSFINFKEFDEKKDLCLDDEDKYLNNEKMLIRRELIELYLPFQISPFRIMKKIIDKK